MQNWSTRHLPPAQQFEYWREVLCEAFTALEPGTSEERRFDSEVWMRPLSDVCVSSVRSSSYTIRRGAREIRRDPAEHYFCDLQLSGTSVVRQHGRQAVVRPGEFFIVDTRQPYEADFLDSPGEEWKIVCLRIPRQRLAPQLVAPDSLTATRFDTWAGPAALAGNFMRSLVSMRGELDEPAQRTLSNSLVDLLALAIGDSRGRGARDTRPAPRERERSRILLYIDSNLGNERLSAASVAAAFGISVRYLHRLFEDTDSSFARRVGEKRLDRCAADLTRRGASVSEVAYRWGFNDLSHFCRMFRRRYGMSAREWQREGRPGDRTS